MSHLFKYRNTVLFATSNTMYLILVINFKLLGITDNQGSARSRARRSGRIGARWWLIGLCNADLIVIWPGAGGVNRRLSSGNTGSIKRIRFRCDGITVWTSALTAIRAATLTTVLTAIRSILRVRWSEQFVEESSDSLTRFLKPR